MRLSALLGIRRSAVSRHHPPRMVSNGVDAAEKDAGNDHGDSADTTPDGRSSRSVSGGAHAGPLFTGIASAVPTAAFPCSVDAGSAVSASLLRLNRPALKPLARSKSLTQGDVDYLGQAARLTWRFFDDLVNQDSNWLPPDNSQLALRVEVARRTSPTNIGLWLASALAAHDFGWLPGHRLRTTLHGDAGHA